MEIWICSIFQLYHNSNFPLLKYASNVPCFMQVCAALKLKSKQNYLWFWFCLLFIAQKGVDFPWSDPIRASLYLIKWSVQFWLEYWLLSKAILSFWAMSFLSTMTTDASCSKPSWNTAGLSNEAILLPSHLSPYWSLNGGCNSCAKLKPIKICKQ